MSDEPTQEAEHEKEEVQERQDRIADRKEKLDIDDEPIQED